MKSTKNIEWIAISRLTVLIPVFLFFLAGPLLAPAVASTEVSGNQYDGSGGPWTLVGSPYIVTGDVNVQEGRTLTIEAGVEVRFNNHTDLEVYGTLLAIGASSAKIIFTSNQITENPGDWEEIIFRPDSANSIIRHCVFQYGGDDGGDDDYVVGIFTDSIQFEDCAVSYSNGDGIRVEDVDTLISRTLISNNTDDGIYCVDASPTIDTCTFKDNGIPLHINGNSFPSFSGNQVFSTSTSDGSMLNGIKAKGRITEDGTWHKAPVPYIVEWGTATGVKDGFTLTIEPGNIIKFPSGNYDFTVEGALIAQGTSEEKIIFTSIKDDACGGDTNGDGPTLPRVKDWSAVDFFDGSNTGNSILDYCVFTYGGNNDQFVVDLDDNVSFPITHCVVSHNYSGIGLQEGYSDTVSHCDISNNQEDGIRIWHASPTITNNTIRGNDYGIRSERGSNPEISANEIWDNASYGVYNGDSSICVDARNNWWGDSSGPLDDSDDSGETCGYYNPNGKGDRVSDYVMYGPWASTPGSRINAPLRSGEILQGDTLRFSGYGALIPGGASFLWDLGDNRKSTLKDPGLVSFPNTGVKAITFALVDSEGVPDTSPASRTITVVADSGAFPDLVVDQFNVPSGLVLGQPAHITYRVKNRGDADITGDSWQDALYISSDKYLDATDTFLDMRDVVSQDVDVDSTYEGTFDTVIQTTGEGGFYLILSVDDQWQVLERHQLNNEAAEATDIGVPLLESGVSLSGTTTLGVNAYYYRIDVPEGKNLRIFLDDLDDMGINQVYLRFGEIPTLFEYDYRYTHLGADQEVFVPGAYAGTWYIMIYTSDPGSLGNFTIEAEVSDITLNSVMPTRHGDTTDMVLTLKGAGFGAGATVELVTGSTAYAADETDVDSFTQITATFSAGSVPPGLYTVRVTQPDKDPAELTDAFEVISGGKPKLETNVIVPSEVGYAQLATIYVEYANTGEVAMPAPLLILTATQNGKQWAIMTLDKSRVTQGFWTSAIPEGFSNTIQILASGETPGVLQPGESERVPVYYAGWLKDENGEWDKDYPPIDFKLGVITTENTQAIDWDSLKDNMRPGSVSADAWQPVWANFIEQVGDYWRDYVAMLDANAAYLGRLGNRIVDVNDLLAFEFSQAAGQNPLPFMAVAVDAQVPVGGLPLGLGRVFPQGIIQRYELGPFGRGWVHSWQMSLEEADDGTVTVIMGVVRRTFQPDRRGGYFSEPGDYGKLTSLEGGAFMLGEANGLLTIFKGDGTLDYVQDANNSRITAGYTSGRLSSLTHTSGHSLQISYNATGRIERITDSYGRETSFSYDGLHEHLISSVGPYGWRTEYSYSTGGSPAKEHALIEIKRPDGTRQYMTYDSAGRVSSIYRDGNSDTVNFSYDSAGKVSVTNNLSESAKFFLDHRGRIVKTEGPLADIFTRSFDNNHHLIRATAPDGSTSNSTYDKWGNLKLFTDSAGNTTNFKYDNLSRLTRFTDAKGVLTLYSYDTRGNPTAITYTDGTTEAYIHDSRGKLSEWTNGRESIVAYSYNGNGLLDQKTYSDSSQASYTYDSRDRIVSGTNAAGTTSFEYYSDDQLKKITYPGDRFLEYTYGAGGRRKSMVDQLGHTVNYHYDALGRLDKMTDETDGVIVRYHFNDAGRLIRKELGNGGYTTYEYDAGGRVIHLINRAQSDSILSRFDYTYNVSGQCVSMSTLDGLWTYEYDATGQLTHAVFDSDNPGIPDQDLSYTYDAMGNRLRTIVNGVSSDYSTNNMNQYTQVGSAACAYDDDGNMTSKTDGGDTWTYTYDDESRLTGVTHGTDIWTYTYDAFGNSVATTKNGSATYYVIDPIGLGNVVAEYESDGDLIAHYRHGIGLLSRESSMSGRAFYNFDSLGSTSEVIDSTGSVLNCYSYDPFGLHLSVQEDIGNPFGFVGEYGVMGETNGLAFMRARFFDSGLGRFLQADPSGISGGLNLYTYAQNNPISGKDPMGLDPNQELMNLMNSYNWWWNSSLVQQGTAYLSEIVTLLQKTGVSPKLISGLGFQTSKNVGRDPGLTSWAGHILGTMGSYYWYYIGSNIPNISAAGGFLGGCLETLALVGGHVFIGAGIGIGIGYVWHLTNFLWINDFLEPAFYQCNEWLGGYLFGVTESGDTVAIFVVGSRDPNQKLGPAGYGEKIGYIKPDSVFPYRVDFENDPEALAPAQVVTVTDQLNSNLDWTTFELTEVGFGDHLIPVLANTQQFEYIEPMTYNEKDIEVHIKIGIDLNSGKISAMFSSIDPETALPPTVDIGFLPPEDDTGRGQGYFSYLIKPKASLATGTEIRNVAMITFDFSTTIATNWEDAHTPVIVPAKECPNTIDADVPNSAVEALPGTSPLIFEVSWSGEDVGAGVGTYTIYVQDNGSDFEPWLTNTEEASAMFTGEAGHTYGFFSVATDNAGNTEPDKTAAEAMTLAEDKYTIALDDGWNLISLYRHPADTSINTVLASIEGKVISVWAFKGNEWKIYDPANPSPDELTTMEAGWAYWINMSDAGTLEFNGSAPTNAIALSSGWNFVGYNASGSQNVTDAIDSIDGKYDLIWAYKDDSWRVYDAITPGFSDLSIMEPGYGYWINATEGCTWTLP